MLRPERMSKVSVTGAKRVMPEVIETAHDLRLVHLESYDDTWDRFRPGDPVEGADDLAETLVTVRSIESILDIDEEDAGRRRRIAQEEIDEEVAEIRERVNALDDRRSALRDERRDIDDQLSTLRPFARLGIDLDLLWGYDSLETEVVRGREDAIVDSLEAAEGVEAYETFAEGDVVAIFVYPEAGAEDALADALVGVEVTYLEVPDAEGDPEEYLADLERRRRQLDARLDSVESELEDVKLEVAGFLLAAEEQLTIEVQKAEAPLQFATTERSFIAEGWVPTDRYDRLETTLHEAVGDHVEVEELERVDYDEVAPGHDHGHGEEGHGDEGPAERRPEREPGREREPGEPTPAPDGGTGMTGGTAAYNQSMHAEEPPVIQDNPDVTHPFQLLVEAINRPRYYELDPTTVIFLTFPVMFGLMIGDVGYGLLYLLMGFGMYRAFDSEAMQSLAGIIVWWGIFTVFFGFFYGELFGFHTIDYVFWDGVLGTHAPIEKGLDSAFALFWLVVAVLIALVHLTVGYLFGFVNELEGHGFKTAAAANLSWILLMNGLWLWVFSRHAAGVKPEFVYTVFDGEPIALGFAGFSPAVGLAGLAVAAIGFVGMVYGEYLHEGNIGIAIGVLESLTGALVHVVSYARITAVLLAKAGMAFVVNLLVVGAYRDEEGHFHFLDPATSTTDHGELMFGGIITTGEGAALAIATILIGAVVFVVGHLIVLGLGITSAGLQGVRLEYVEFFSKFYDGGGEEYEPFGHERTYTSD